MTDTVIRYEVIRADTQTPTHQRIKNLHHARQLARAMADQLQCSIDIWRVEYRNDQFLTHRLADDYVESLGSPSDPPYTLEDLCGGTEYGVHWTAGGCL